MFRRGYALRGSSEYEPDFLYLNSDLASELNHISTGEGAMVRWGLTPYTRIAVEFARQRDRFEFSPDRDADFVWVAPSVEFSPRALVSGRALVGLQRRRFLTVWRSRFHRVSCLRRSEYTILERKRFGFSARRGLESLTLSPRETSHGVTISVTRVLDVRDAGGSLGVVA